MAKEAEENFVSSMISNIKQRPFREMDIDELIDKEIEDMPGTSNIIQLDIM